MHIITFHNIIPKSDSKWTNLWIANDDDDDDDVHQQTKDADENQINGG